MTDFAARVGHAAVDAKRAPLSRWHATCSTCWADAPRGHGPPALAAMMNEATKQKVLARLRKIAGQVEGVARMVEEDRYCVDVLLQIASAQGALGEAGKLVLRSHIETCVSAVLVSGRPDERKQKLDELMQVLSRYGCMGAR